MANILNIETSTKACSVALSTDNELIFYKENKIGFQHASLLGAFVEEALDYVKKSRLKMDAVAVSGGPGSYTGLRIGVSEAKGLCCGLNVPLIAVSSLEIMADEVIRSGYEADFYFPMIDARRMEVYTVAFDKRLRPLQNISAAIIDENSFKGYLSKGRALFFGDGSDKCQTVIQSPRAGFIKEIYPLASSMIYLSEKAFNEGNFEDVAYYEPFYLKEFVVTIAKNKGLPFAPTRETPPNK